MPLENQQTEGSSPEVETQDVHSGSSPETQDGGAGSSPALDAERESSPREEGVGAEEGQEGPDYENGLQAAIRDALGRKDDGASGEQQTTDETGEGEGEGEGAENKGAADEKGEQTEDAKSKDKQPAGAEDEGEGLDPEQRVPYPRFKSVIDARNELRGKVEQLEPRAKQYDQVEAFMQEHAIQAQEVAQALQIVALMKHDPLRARDELSKTMQQLDQFAGKVLPEDLQTEVDEGTISEQRAQELAATRNQSRFQQERQRQTEQTRQQEEDRRAQAQAVQANRDAVTRWERDIQASDPDYKRIQPLVIRELQVLVSRHPPQTPEQAVELAKQAHQTVKDQVRQLVPARREQRPGPSSADTGATSGSRPEPQSFMDAVRQAANGQ